jgi:hypothetical protein
MVDFRENDVFSLWVSNALASFGGVRPIALSHSLTVPLACANEPQAPAKLLKIKSCDYD